MKLYFKYFLHVIFIVTIYSCTSDVDFDQSKSIEFNQNFSLSFIYLDVNQTQFLNADASAEIPTLIDVSTIDAFDSEYFQDNLVKTIFNFQIENSFNRGFNIEFSFLNADDAVTNTFSINMPNNSSQTYLHNVEGLDLLSLKFSQKLRVVINLQPSSDSSILVENAEMKLSIKSFTNFIFKLN